MFGYNSAGSTTTIDDLKSCCWCCLSKSGIMVPLFSTSLDSLINSLSDIKVEKIEGYRQQVCKRCITKITTAYEFIKLLRSSQVTINNLLIKQINKEKNENGIQSHTCESKLRDDNTQKTQEIIICDNNQTYPPNIEEAMKYNIIVSNENYVPAHTSKTNILTNDLIVIKNVENYHINEENKNFMDLNTEIQRSQFREHDDRNEITNINNSDENTLNDHDITQNGHITIDSGFIEDKLIEREKTIDNEAYNKEVCSEKITPKPYLCTLCGLSFKWRSSLCKHERLHNGKSFICYICDLPFPTKSAMKIHKLSHLGIKRYQCTVCEQKFSQKSSLNCHYKIHANKRHYVCNICNMSFTQKGTLTTHMRIHTGEKPFKCECCTAKFSWRGSLKQHMLTHMKTDKKKRKLRSQQVVGI